MSVNITKNADGTVTCWGKEPMFIPEGGSHVRVCYISSLPEFAEEPSVTLSISGGRGVEVFLLSEITPASPSFNSFKINATNGRAMPSDFEYVCYFNVIGKPL
jgi:hypothetical protein